MSQAEVSKEQESSFLGRDPCFRSGGIAGLDFPQQILISQAINLLDGSKDSRYFYVLTAEVKSLKAK